jgi:N-acetylmuramoyl-L-alanine amidase
VIEKLSPNFNERKLPISMIVLHYTGMPDAQSAIQWLANPESKVSAHYVVTEEGDVVRMVAEDKRAWHAGESYWRGISDVNSASIGIEIVNPGHEWGYREFPDAQIEALIPLVHEIVQRYGITRGNIVGHSDVAPERKLDPGELFPWAKLARLRLALPRPTKHLMDPLWSDSAFMLALERFGYDIKEPPCARSSAAFARS